MPELRAYLRKSGAGFNDELYRYIGLTALLDSDRGPFQRAIARYLPSPLRKVVNERVARIEPLVPKGAELRARATLLGDRLARQPFSLMAGLALLDEAAQDLLAEPLPENLTDCEARLAREFAGLLPQATNGCAEFVIMVHWMVERTELARAAAATTGPVWIALLHGGRVKRRTPREWVTRLRKELHKLYRQRGARQVRRDAEAWVFVRKRHYGDSLAAWEALPSKFEFNNDRTVMVDAIRPFDRAFGLELPRGRPKLQRESDGYRVGVAPRQAA